MNRSDYLKQFLVSRGVPEQSLRKRELTFAEVQKFSYYELE